MKYITQDREAGNRIESFDTLADAEHAIELYEEDDMREGAYTPNFYEVSAE